ncbi:DUF4406 domain-containing protein [Mucilaginibacter sp. KACC 22773]|uniref:DUF4406 domain-containing protein n=1 Tax=Mucilaginibacter sp. KACC 22773 TaxID=3025671 RepID=UPI002366BA46|nr:DUF4406 domain-containing protein [Mucilaginibacter sp. KACC 22773]WDF80352.1 DUF4406 domain-containing protein [Mucilaginibacter sp. KACC 22773]
MTSKPLIILIAGPYRSGTNDDPELMANNLRKMEEVALPIFRAGHIPVIGEWLALPLLKQAGSTHPCDEAYQEISYPVSRRILAKCDAILRIPGESKGADGDVQIALEQGIKVYYNLEDIIAL